MAKTKTYRYRDFYGKHLRTAEDRRREITLDTLAASLASEFGDHGEHLTVGHLLYDDGYGIGQRVCETCLMLLEAVDGGALSDGYQDELIATVREVVASAQHEDA